MKLCVFDIGGTKIKYGVVTDQGDIIVKFQMDTEAQAGGPAILHKLIETSKRIIREFDIGGIAVSSAGQIDSKEGKVVFATETIPKYTGLPIKAMLEKEIGLPVAVENDVNCAALGEYWQGIAKNEDEFIALTLGTGVGGAIVIGGKIYTGSSYSAGEFGHINLYPNGVRCSCGSKGCYEMYASSKALEDKIKETCVEKIDAFKAFRLAQEGYVIYNEIIDSWVRDMSLGLKSIVHIFNPKLIVIGGGISEQGDFLLKKIQQELDKHLMISFKKKLTIKIASRGNEANLLGAAYHFIKHKETK